MTADLEDRDKSREEAQVSASNVVTYWQIDTGQKSLKGIDVLVARVREAILAAEQGKREAEERARKAEEELQDFYRTMFIPGEQECPSCDFGLSSRVLRASDGAVGVNAAAPLEPCPNGCGPMISITWERGFRRMATVAESQAERATALEAEVAQLKAERDRMHMQTIEYAQGKKGELKQAQRRVEVLEKALRHAMEWLKEEGCDCGTNEQGTCALCEARAALQGTEPRPTEAVMSCGHTPSWHVYKGVGPEVSACGYVDPGDLRRRLGLPNEPDGGRFMVCTDSHEGTEPQPEPVK